MLIQLGQFQFSVKFGYNSLERTRQWEWSEVPIISDDPILQFSGRTREISFEGTYWEYRGDGDEVEALEQIADNASPLGLTDDRGHFYGFWVISSLSRTERHFRREQKLGLRTDWNLRLKFYGDTKERGAGGGETASVATHSIQSVRRQTIQNTSPVAKAKVMKSAADSIVESNDDTALADLKNIREYNSLIRKTKNAQTVFDNVIASSNTIQDTPISELPSDSPFFDNIERLNTFLESRQDYRNRIARTIKKVSELSNYDTIKSSFESTRTSMVSISNELEDVRDVEQSIKSMLRFREYKQYLESRIS